VTVAAVAEGAKWCEDGVYGADGRRKGGTEARTWIGPDGRIRGDGRGYRHKA
jgi:hypothetical protein